MYKSFFLLFNFHRVKGYDTCKERKYNFIEELIFSLSNNTDLVSQ